MSAVMADPRSCSPDAPNDAQVDASQGDTLSDAGTGVEREVGERQGGSGGHAGGEAGSDGDLWGGFRELDRQLDVIRRELARHHRLTTLGTMAATIAHEINNVLTPVGSYAQLALGRPGDEELTRKALLRARDGAERAARIASAVLGLAGDGDEPAVSDLAAVVSDTVGCLVRDPSRDGIDLATDVPAGLTAGIEPGKLQQVLLNLMLNACRAMRSRGGRLAVMARAGGEGDGGGDTRGLAGPVEPTAGSRGLRGGSGRVVIEVRDTGPGIPEAVRERLFEPFVTAVIDPLRDAEPSGRTGSGGSGGTGLGLCVCRQLIERAGGTIGVTTVAAPAEGHGTVFTIELPAAGAAGAAGGAGGAEGSGEPRAAA